MIAGHGLVDSFLSFTTTYVIFALAAGLAFSTRCRSDRQPRTSPSDCPMRIAFDGTTLTPGRTGVGYYTEHLLQHLAREVEATGDELIVISNQPIDTAHRCRGTCASTTGRRFPLRIGWMQLLAGRVLDDIRADVAHFTNGMMPLGTRAARRS